MSKHVTDASMLHLSWKKSTYSAAQSDCVETAEFSTALVAVRDSKNPSGPALLFERDAVRAFVTSVAGGAFSR